VAQRPKLAGFIPQMEENLAKAVGVEKEDVNVKATTTEKLGFEGEGLGMSAYAVCTIKKRT
jgi:2-C-methyl-D-erythritol 2,4-cyclodiphosphate synthase